MRPADSSQAAIAKVHPSLLGRGERGAAGLPPVRNALVGDAGPLQSAPARNALLGDAPMGEATLPVPADPLAMPQPIFAAPVAAPAPSPVAMAVPAGQEKSAAVEKMLGTDRLSDPDLAKQYERFD